ncbi:MAG: hypothetical protein NZL93_05555, partial [Chthoniobacterales bacterium]|nr:hypothetical protein [Chthoniobacterales bacterium]
MKKSKITIGKRIGLGFAAVLAVFGLFGIFAIITLITITSKAEVIVQKVIPMTKAISKLAYEIAEFRISARSYGHTAKEKYLQDAKGHLNEVQKTFNQI